MDINYFNIVVAIGLAVMVNYIVIIKKDNQIKNNNNELYNQSQSNNLNKYNKGLYEFVGMAFIMLLTIIPRVIKFGSVPGGVNQDGAMAGVDALAIATYGTDRFGTHMPVHLYAWGFGQMSSFLSYMQVPFVKLFGLNNITLRLPILIFSVFGIIAIYVIIRKICGVKAAFMAGIIVAINPWHFIQSRWALDCNMFPHVFVIGLALLIYGINNKKCLYMSMIFFGLCMYTYGVSFYFVPFFLLATCIYLALNKNINIKDILVCIGIYFLISWPEYMVMLINLMKWETIKLPFFTIQLFPDSVRSSDILFFSPNGIWKQLTDNFHSVIKVIFMQEKDLPWNDIEGFGTLYKFSWPFWILGLVISVIRALGLNKEDKGNAKTFYVIVLFYFIFAILLGLMINGINVNRCNIAYYANMLLIIIGIDYIVSKSKISIGLIGIMYSIAFTLLLTTYFGSYSEQISHYFYSDFIDAVKYAKELNAEKYLFTPDVQYEGAYMSTEILVDYVFEIDAEYYQGITDDYMKVKLPYNERFRFGNRHVGDLIDDNIVYVIKLRNDYDELSDFSSDRYNIMTFDNEYAVISKR